MQSYEYKVVPAPKKGQRAKGVKGTDGKFANALQLLMNEHGAEGWEYLRTDTLPCEERLGLTGRTTTYQNLLIFRRTLRDSVEQEAPAQEVGPVAAPAAQPASEPSAQPTSDPADSPADKDDKATGKAPALGGVLKGDPGKTARAPDRAER